MSPTLRFVPAMYAAALSGRKTQTRRVITPQPSGLIDSWHLHERNKDTVSFFDAPGEEWDGTYLTQRYINSIEGSQDDEPHGSAKEWYREIWDSINATRGKGESKGCYAWNKNPWVFATMFELVS